MLLKSLFSRLALPIRGRTLAISLTLATVLVAAGCGGLALKERELTFRVEPGTASWYGGLPSEVAEFDLPVAGADRTQHIHAWWWPAGHKDAPAVLYLHGARWNLTGQLFRIEQLRDFGFSVLAIDYRGFGKSSGDYPSEQTVYQDARTAWQRLVRLQPDAGKRFIYGHSLGGAVAIDLAASLAHPGKPPAANGLIVESSFSSLADIARALTYRWLPMQLLLSQKFDSADKIRGVDMPVLIVHGAADKYVPAYLSEKLFAAAPGRKKLLLVPGATHNNCMRLGEEQYRAALTELFGVELDY